MEELMLMRRHADLQITVHYPQSDDVLRELAAKIHADTLCRIVQDLPCSDAQKLQLLDAVIHDLRARC